jgi:hypothetical protein
VRDRPDAAVATRTVRARIGLNTGRVLNGSRVLNGHGVVNVQRLGVPNIVDVHRVLTVMVGLRRAWESRPIIERGGGHQPVRA